MAGGIFINYRRGDDPGNTGRLCDRLQEVFRPEQLFMDVDSIPPGLDFVRVLEEHVAKCDVLLAVIGRNWIDARDETGARRLDNPEDFVRIEIESALKQGKRVIPVLVHEARMPRPDELAEAIRPLARRNAVRLTHERFRADVQGLIKALQQALEEVETLHQAQAEAARQAQAEEQRTRDEETARERARLQRETEEQERRKKEQARLTAIAGLSPEHIAKAEELANWDFIKESSRPQEFRDHLARFPGGVCERIARSKLGVLAWASMGEQPDRISLYGYLEEFPDGAHAEDVRARLASLDREEDREEGQGGRARPFEPPKASDNASVAPVHEAFPAHGRTAESRALHGNFFTRNPAHWVASRATGNLVGGSTVAVLGVALLVYSFFVPSPGVPRVISLLVTLLGVGVASGLVPVRSPRDLYGGTVLVMLGGLALLASADLPGQRGFAFGPGTAPRLFSVILAALGAVVALGGVFAEGPPIERYKIRGPALVIIAILTFAALIRPLGMVPATFLAFMISIFGSTEMRWIESLIGAAVMTLGCVLLFVYLLNLPFQLWPRFS